MGTGTKSDNLRDILALAEAGNTQALARLLSQIESLGAPVVNQLPQLITGEKRVFRVGITGPPGAGKSTMISQLIKYFRSQAMKVAVLAVDPSSPFTQGAILGDRIRYSEHFLDENVFIRSMGTRGSLGGLSGSAYLSLRAFDQMDFDIVLIETVGVGQTELEIVNVADFTIVTLVPESGDGIQAMKAGLSEIADLFVVNKCDRPGADALVRELDAAAMPMETGEDAIKVLKTIASEGEGIDEVAKVILAERKTNKWILSRNEAGRLQQEGKALLRLQFENQIHEKSLNVKNKEDLLSLVKS